MELLLKKHFWLFNSLLIIGIAFATSRAVSSYVEYEVFKVPYVESIVEKVEGGIEDEEFIFRRPAIPRNPDLDSKLAPPMETPPEAVDPMGVSAGPTDLTPATGQPEEQAPEAIEEPKAQITVQLVGVMTSMSGVNNTAMIKIDGGPTEFVRVGQELRTGYRVTEISNFYIRIDPGIIEYVWKEKEPPPVEKTALADAKASKKGRSEEKKAEPQVKPEKAEKKVPVSPYEEGVAKVGENEYRVDRGMLDDELQDLGKLGRGARVIPNYNRDTGEYDGFKLIGVRPDSLYKALGIKSGDIIASINGETLSSPTKALELFNQLKTSSEIKMQVVRRGKEETFAYTIE